MIIIIYDTGPPGAAGGSRLLPESRETGCKNAGGRGERTGKAYQPISPETSQNAKEGSCRR
jgi:hypothetical protein